MRYWITNGIVHTAVQREACKTDILIEDGKIAALGKANGGESVDAAGLNIYPGLVEAHCHLGLDGRVRPVIEHPNPPPAFPWNPVSVQSTDC